MKQIRETSTEVAEMIIKEAHISDLAIEDFEYYRHRKISLLEPSAGKGKLLDTLFDKYSFDRNAMDIDCVELNKENCEVLKSKGYNTYQQDFLTFESPDNLGYDRIIACPPFKGNIDLLHIKKMYTLLNHKGILVTLTSPYWITNNEEIHIDFRKWLIGKEYKFTMLPDNSFMEKGKTVHTGMLVFTKYNSK